MSQYCIVIEQGEPRGGVFLLNEGTTVLGRNADCDICLPAKDVSRKHVSLHLVNGVVTATNLSNRGTVCEAEKLGDAPKEIALGSRLYLGKNTVLQLSDASSYEVAEIDEDATVGACELDDDEGKTQAGATVAGDEEPVPHDEDMDGGETVAPAEDFDDDNLTHVMKTLDISGDDIQVRRRKEELAYKFRVGLVGLVFLLVGIVIVAALSVKSKPPSRIVWPLAANGQKLVRYEDGMGPGYQVVLPDTADCHVQRDDDELLATFSLGNPSVPYTFRLTEVSDKRNVSSSLADSIARWKSLGSVTNNAEWSFTRGKYSDLFYGQENGIPFSYEVYTRVDSNAVWKGNVYFIRHGERLIVSRIEVQAKDIGRTKDFLNSYFLLPDRNFVLSHWEGAGGTPASISPEQLGRLKAEMQRPAPVTWEKLEDQLFEVLRVAVRDDLKGLERDAEAMLISLREQKSLWMNSQMLMRDEALRNDDSRKLHEISERCRAVFRDPRDKRYFEVRRW